MIPLAAMEWLAQSAAPVVATDAVVAGASAAQPGFAAVRAAQPDVRWNTSKADIQGYGKAVTRKQAHSFMSQWRTLTSGTAEMEKDLTDQTDFDWVGYLKLHPDIDKIVPDEKFVVSFAIQRVAAIDTNTKSARVDFVVLLDDGHRVRLHPSQAKEACPVIVPPGRDGIFTMGEVAGREALRGVPVEVGRAACAAQPGLVENRRPHYIGASAADLLMPSQVKGWLAERAALWPDVPFTQDITSQSEPLAPRKEPLPWHLFVAAIPQLQKLQPFQQVFVVWTDCPALYFKTQSGDEVVVDLGDKSRKGVSLHRDRVHLCRWDL